MLSNYRAPDQWSHLCRSTVQGSLLHQREPLQDLDFDRMFGQDSKDSSGARIVYSPWN